MATAMQNDAEAKVEGKTRLGKRVLSAHFAFGAFSYGQDLAPWLRTPRQVCVIVVVVLSTRANDKTSLISTQWNKTLDETAWSGRYCVAPFRLCGRSQKKKRHGRERGFQAVVCKAESRTVGSTNPTVSMGFGWRDTGRPGPNQHGEYNNSPRLREGNKKGMEQENRNM